MACYIDIAKKEDIRQIAECLQRNGLHGNSSIKELVELLHWKYFENPIHLEADYADYAKGFVIRDDSDVHGFTGSCPRKCFYGPKPFLMSVMGDLAVDKSYRKPYAVRLVTQYLSQPGIAIYISGTTNRIAAKFFERSFSFSKYPGDRFVKPHLGIFSTYSLVLRMLQRFKLPLPIIRPLAWICFKPYDILRNKMFLSTAKDLAGTAVKIVDEIDGYFTKFQESFLERNNEIVIDRCPESLKWIWGKKLPSEKCVIIARENEQGMLGYIVLERKVSESFYVKYEIADWVSLSLDKDVLEQLLLDACCFCIKQNISCLHSVGFPEKYQAILSKYLPVRLDMGVNRCMFKIADKEIAEVIDTDIDKWFLSTFDTDWVLGT